MLVRRLFLILTAQPGGQQTGILWSIQEYLGRRSAGDGGRQQKRQERKNFEMKKYHRGGGRKEFKQAKNVAQGRKYGEETRDERRQEQEREGARATPTEPRAEQAQLNDKTRTNPRTATWKTCLGRPTRTRIFISPDVLALLSE